MLILQRFVRGAAHNRATAAPLALAAVLVSLAWSLTLAPQIDPDYWWHIQTGDWIASHGAVPRSDLFSWWAAGAPWVAHEWGAELIMGLLHQVSGLYGWEVLCALVSASSIAVLISILRLRRPLMSPIALAALALVAVAVGLDAWSPRVQIFDVLFSLIALRGLLGYLERGERSWLYAMPAVMLLWVNLHAAAVVFYVLIALAVLVGQALNQRCGWAGVRRPLRPLLLSTGLTVVATLLNPFTYEVWVLPLQTAFSPVMHQLVVEWMAPDFSQPAKRVAGLYIVALTVLPGLVKIRDARAWLLSGGLLLMSLGAQRYLLLFGPLSVALLGPYLADAAALLWRRLRLPSMALAGLSRASIAVLVVLSLAIPVLRTATLLAPTAQEAAIAELQPVAATDWARRELRDVGRVYNAYGWGGWISRELETKIATYGENTLVGDERLLLADQIERGIEPRRVLDELSVDTVIFNPQTALDSWLASSDEWCERYRDAVAVIYTRSGAASCPSPVSGSN